MKSRQLIIVLLLLGLSYACKTKSKENLKLIQFNLFVMTVPANWDKIEDFGIDSYVAGLSNGDDTIHIEIGQINPFIEDIRIYPLSEKAKRPHSRQGATIVFSDDPERDYRLGIYNKYVSRFDTIDNYLSKITYPKEETKGLSEVFFGDIKHDTDLLIRSPGLSVQSRKDFFEMIKTIRFSQEKVFNNKMIGELIYKKECISCHGQIDEGLLTEPLNKVVFEQGYNSTFEWIKNPNESDTLRERISYKRQRTGLLPEYQHTKCIIPKLADKEIESLIYYISAIKK